jgi:hypothetical protein
MDASLDFGLDLTEVRDRVRTLSYFTDVLSLEDATLDLQKGIEGIPPLAYVSTVSETASPNRLTGTLAQRVTVKVSVLFCIPIARADKAAREEMDETRKAVVRILLGWRPTNALDWLEYDRFLLRASDDGLLWGEVLMSTSYRLELAS